MALTACGAAGSDSDEARTETGSLPPPPQELRLEGVNPCRLLTSEQLQALDVGGERASPADSRRGPICLWNHYQSEPVESYLVELLAGRDIEDFLTLPGKTTPTQIIGFPAVQTDFQGLGTPRPGACTVLVGVAEGAAVQISYSYSGSRTADSEQSCAKARTAAEMVTQTLISRGA